VIAVLLQKPLPWLTQDAPETDVVLQTRVSVSRNLADFPFPARCSAEEKKRVENRVLNAVAEKNGFPKDGYCCFQRLSVTERQFLVERELAVEPLLHNDGARGVLVSGDQSTALVINGPDHVHIRTLTAGLQPQPAWTRVNKLDDLLRSSLDYAFREPLGFLTASLWLVGTGLRAEAVLHLPALTLEKSILTLEHDLRRRGHVLDGVFGSIRNAPGEFYRLMNGITLGKTEDELLLAFSQTVRDVVFRERTAREKLLAEARLSLEDRVGRAVGLAGGVRLLDFEEALGLLSSIRLGVSSGLLDKCTLETCNTLLMQIKPAHIDVGFGSASDELTRNKKRAELFRAHFTS